jgi:hypothetical protein
MGTPVQDVALSYLAMLEDLATEVVALRVTLALEAEGFPNWRDEVEKQRTACVQKVRDLFAPSRALAGETHSESPRPKGIHLVVRRVVDSVLTEDDSDNP